MKKDFVVAGLYVVGAALLLPLAIEAGGGVGIDALFVDLIACSGAFVFGWVMGRLLR